jgi:hypothetical protein
MYPQPVPELYRKNRSRRLRFCDAADSIIMGRIPPRSEYNPNPMRLKKRMPKMKRLLWKSAALASPAAVLILLVLATARSPRAAQDPADSAMQSIRPEAIRAGMRFLSDDLLEGRGTGSRGYDIAAEYMATEFEAMGLEGAGEKGSYFQSVPLRSAMVDEDKSSVTLVRDGREEVLIPRTDFISRADPGREDTSVEAPVVFVGTGVTAPEQNYDDYKGVDVKGKIVALLYPAPPSFDSAIRAHYSSGVTKSQNAVAHGAVGVILLNDPQLEEMYPFQKRVRDLSFSSMRWLDVKGQPNDYFPELKALAMLSSDASQKFFAGSGHTADEVYAAAKAGKPLSFALPMTARIRNVTKLADVHGKNVAAILRGSDASLAPETIVFSAHLDHLGVGEPVKGDTIYNGTLDNASGSAILLEVARAFARMKPRPRRSMLFLSVTGEEKGLLGSDYFAHYPTVEKKNIVANVNMDEDLMLWPLKDMVAFGAEHSSLANVVQAAASRMDLGVSADPMPQEVIFIRSDQYSFVKQGIPSMFLVPGFKSDDPKINPQEIFKNWEETRYHQPQDDMEQPGLDFEAAAKYARFVFLCGWDIAQQKERPRWNSGDFFGERYAKGAGN